MEPARRVALLLTCIVTLPFAVLAATTPDPSGIAIPLDTSRQVTVGVTIETDVAGADLAPLAHVLTEAGFRPALDIDETRHADRNARIAMRLRGTRTGPFDSEAFNALSRRLTPMADAIGAKVSWSFSQDRRVTADESGS